MTAKAKKKPGPNGDTLRIEGGWQDAVKHALAKKPPASGVPARQTKKRKKRKTK